MQSDKIEHKFNDYSYFEEVIDLYNFDRHLRLLMFDAIERIEVALRTKLIYQLSLSYGPLCYIDYTIFSDKNKQNNLRKKGRPRLTRESRLGGVEVQGQH